MQGTSPERGAGALATFLGHWQGNTRFAAGPWGPERSVPAEVTYRLVAGGFAVVQSYRHVEPDGTHFEGHGMFTLDPVHDSVLWYYVDSASPAQTTPARCIVNHGALLVERHGSAGWTRHTLRVDEGVLTHVAELRIRDGAAARADSRVAGGTGSAYSPVMSSSFHRS